MPGPAGDREGGPPSPSLPERLVGHLAFAGAVIASGLVLVALATVGYSVVMRYVLDTPITWTDELSGYLVVGIVMLGAAESLRKGDHISVDLLTSKVRGARLRALRVWWMVAVALVAGAMIYSALIMVEFSFDVGIYSEGYLEMPMWIPQAVFLAGAVLLLAMAISRLLTLVLGLRSG